MVRDEDRGSCVPPPQPASAADEQEAIPELSREQLLALIATGRVQLVEALGPSYYADVHLPGAVNIPHDLVPVLAPALLPDKDSIVVVYCSDAACRNSAAAARRLRHLGYGDVRRYRGGKQDWIAAGLDVERLDGSP